MAILDILDIIPQSLKQQVVDTLVDFVSGEAKKYVSGEIANKIRSLRSDAAFHRTFEKGLQQAVKRFIAEYEAQDEDLVAALQADRTFLANAQVQKAMLTMLRKPGTYLAEEREKLAQSFDSVLPKRKNRERVDQAVTYFLRCLVEELWHLPELLPVYSLQFQRLNAEAAQQQVALQKAQLQALTGLGEGVRTALLQLTDAIGEQKALPAGGRYALPERPKVYHNLPQPDYGRFIGREAELAQVEKILRPYPHSQHALVTIDGIGGIGKSALALEIGHRFLRQFDDLPAEERFEAIIWASAKQTILTAEGISTRRQILRTLDDIYNALAVGLQREDITRARKEDQDEVVRRALTRQRTLLLVDNLETVDDEAVLNFLRELPAPTKAIVTTRHRLDVAYPVRLTGMPWDDASQLIEQECAKKGVTLDVCSHRFSDVPPDARSHRFSDASSNAEVFTTNVVTTNGNARRLFERTGGVPLAMVWSIAQMGMGYGVETVLNRLGQPAGDIARFCFEGAVEQIKNRPAHKLLMVLSLCADSASRESLGYATGLPELDRDDGLVKLEKLSLVNKSGDRFSLLPLTKQYAAAEFEKSEKKELLREKWIEYFSKLTKEYSIEYWNWKNYSWLQNEGDNLLSIIDWTVAAEQGDIALLFTRATMFYLDRTGQWTKLFDYGEQLYSIAQSLQNKRIWAWICHLWLAYFYVERGNHERAEAVARQSLLLYQELNDVKGTCFALNDLGRVYRVRGKYETAQDIYTQSMNLAKRNDFGDGMAAAHFELGKLARDREQWENSKTHFEAVIEWCEKHEEEADLDIALLMMAIGNLGWVEFNLGHSEHGKLLMERSLSFFQGVGGGKASMTTLHWRLANIEKTFRNSEKALQHAQEAYFWAERLGMVRELEGARALLAELEQAQPAAGN
ncbi:hypothetical protein U27_05466 [Candidatus Vecturithrix granuli]|uniref:Orc1-like AAA ATPase domain-containing protein n=1 Tax=Vecturithrix granuli TaxID=1499967 RepID=A0A081C1N7_VECG1|nr:hypothetical protein U27_05466 [Candidatus Vecturithrix granuli]